MNLAYCKSYLEVVERGSFSEAARALGLSQPTVSFQVRRLEEEAGARLMERRGPRQVGVTAAGREFETFARRVLAEHAALMERLSALRDEVAGALRLGASTHPGEHLVPAIVGAFRRRHPKISATIAIGDTAEIVDRVLGRQCDAGFVGAEVRRRGLVSHKIAEDQLVLIAAPDHPIARRRSVRLSDLAGESFVVREPGSGTQRTVDELMEAAGLHPRRLRPALVVGSNQAVVAAVEAGVGVAFAPRAAAARSLELGRVRAVPVRGTDWVRGIYFVHVAGAPKTRLLQAFAAFVDEWSAGQLPARPAAGGRSRPSTAETGLT